MLDRAFCWRGGKSIFSISMLKSGKEKSHEETKGVKMNLTTNPRSQNYL